jgi:hypothetical protein
MLKGITTQSGILVDRIVDIRCTNADVLAVNVGGTGGTLNTNDCWWPPGPAIPSARAYINSIYSRSGHLLDSLAPSCIGPFDFTEKFDPIPATVWSPFIADAPPPHLWGHAEEDFFSSVLGNFDLQQGAGPNRGSLTGPSYADDGGYFLLDSTVSVSAGVERLTLDLRDIPTGQTRLRFRYYLFGSGFPIIEAFARPSSGGTVVSLGSVVGGPGVQHDQWQDADFNLTGQHGKVIDLQLIGFRGFPNGDVAIDSVRVVSLP